MATVTEQRLPLRKRYNSVTGAFGVTLRRYRLRLGLSQNALARGADGFPGGGGNHRRSLAAALSPDYGPAIGSAAEPRPGKRPLRTSGQGVSQEQRESDGLPAGGAPSQQRGAAPGDRRRAEALIHTTELPAARADAEGSDGTAVTSTRRPPWCGCQDTARYIGGSTTPLASRTLVATRWCSRRTQTNRKEPPYAIVLCIGCPCLV